MVKFIDDDIIIKIWRCFFSELQCVKALNTDK